MAQVLPLSTPDFPTRLRHAVDCTAGLVGEDFLRDVVRELAHALDSRYAFVSQQLDTVEGNRERTLAFWMGNDIGPNFEYDRAGTPCESVPNQGLTFFPSGVPTRFPMAHRFHEFGVESFLAVPFVNREQSYLGHLGVMDTKPLDPRVAACDSLSVLGARVGAEVQRQQLEQQLLFMATHDALTGLPNRTLFWDRLRTAVQRAARGKHHVALVDLEVHGLREINEQFGEAAGDALLAEVARRLREGVRNTDTVCRIGSSQFGVVLESIRQWQNVDGVSRALVRRVVADPVAIGEDSLDLEVSAGVAVYPEDGEDDGLLLSRADRARFQIKRAGGGLLFYHHSAD